MKRGIKKIKKLPYNIDDHMADRHDFIRRYNRKKDLEEILSKNLELNQGNQGTNYLRIRFSKDLTFLRTIWKPRRL